MAMIALLPLAGWLGKGWLLIKFIVYRMAVWSGTVYLFRRGRKTHNAAYYALAIIVYAASWMLIALSVSRLTAWAVKLLERS